MGKRVNQTDDCQNQLAKLGQTMSRNRSKQINLEALVDQHIQNMSQDLEATKLKITSVEQRTSTLENNYQDINENFRTMTHHLE